MAQRIEKEPGEWKGEPWRVVSGQARHLILVKEAPRTLMDSCLLQASHAPWWSRSAYGDYPMPVSPFYDRRGRTCVFSLLCLQVKGNSAQEAIPEEPPKQLH